MKTGLTKKQKTTAIYFDEDSPWIEVSTYNTDLKNRMTTFAESYPHECKLIDDDELGCKTFEVKKGRFGFKLTAPYTEERCKAAGELAKKYIKNLRRSEQ
ncbi:hypothetical protein [Ruminococcus sp. Marseille-P6503]|uniref:hypothetical protein n=1 Tax=Ruminococcus sp. Marseille-P6503 TaxID=2364796 RepID=UPI000F51C4EA|nr:hypothetical protein [Ruminococcus sp. Marseille-P6503]